MCLRGGLYLVHASEGPSVLSAMGKMPNFCFLLIFPFPPKILIVNNRAQDVDERWADFAWHSW